MPGMNEVELEHPAGTEYLVCIRDDAATTPTLVFEGAIAPGGAWNTKRSGFHYENKASASGISKVQLKPGIDGKAGIVVGGKGANLGGLALPLAVPVRAQVINDVGGCWETYYSAAPINTSTKFKATGSPSP